MAASLSIGHPIRTINTSTPPSRSTSRNHICLSCQSREPIDSSDLKTEKVDKGNNHLFTILYGGIQKLRKGLKDELRPKQKGDWKDLMLMSFSFAVYIYMSQKIVCAYCAWMSMPKQPW